MRSSSKLVVAFAFLPLLALGCAANESDEAAAESDLTAQKIVSVSNEGQSFCALREDGQALCWKNYTSAFSGGRVDTKIHVVKDAGDIAQISPTSAYNLRDRWAVRKNGTLVSLIENDTWYRSVDNYTSVSDGSELPKVKKVFGMTVLTIDGRLFTLEGGNYSSRWTEVPEVKDAIDYVAGGRLECILDKKHQVFCKGGGNGMSMGPYKPYLKEGEHLYYFGWTHMKYLGEVEQVVTASNTVCVLKKNGHVLCVGNAYNTGAGGEPSETDPTNTKELREVRGLDDVTQISANGEGTAVCALQKTGTVACWGGNFFPDSPIRNLMAPELVSTLYDATWISVVDRNTGCAINGKGKPLCWGYIGNGVIASNTQDKRLWGGSIEYTDIPAPIGGL